MTYSTVTKNNLSLTTNLSSDLQLKMPVLSYADDANSAIQLALLGSIGILKHSLDIIDKVHTVKKYIEYVIPSPFTVHPQMTIEQVQYISKQLDINTFPVVSLHSNFFIGMICINHDVHIIGTDIEPYIIPRDKVVTVDSGISRGDALKKINEYVLDVLPIVNSNGHLCGIITPESLSVWNNNIISLDSTQRLLVGVELKVDLVNGKTHSKYDLERLIESGVDLLIINVFHPHHILVGDTISQIREVSSIPIAVGNVTTTECELYLLERGATIIITDDPTNLKHMSLITTSSDLKYPMLIDKVKNTQIEETLKRLKYDYIQYMIVNNKCIF